MIDTSFLITEPAEKYHASAKENLSSHQLGNFRKCPQLYLKKILGLIPDEDRPAYVVGRAAHTLILEGSDVFDSEYAVGGPINSKTGKPYGSNTKAYGEWATAQGKPVLTDSQYALITNMAEGVHKHEIAMNLLADGVPEGVVRTNYQDIKCQIRMDWFHPEHGIVDLKTCDDMTWFEADARRYGYVHQLAFYRSVLAVAIGQCIPVHLIAVEKKEPFRCGVWVIGQDVLGLTQKENEEAIARLKECRNSDQWPTGYEAVRTLDYL